MARIKKALDELNNLIGSGVDFLNVHDAKRECLVKEYNELLDMIEGFTQIQWSDFLGEIQGYKHESK